MKAPMKRFSASVVLSLAIQGCYPHYDPFKAIHRVEAVGDSRAVTNYALAQMTHGDAHTCVNVLSERYLSDNDPEALKGIRAIHDKLVGSMPPYPRSEDKVRGTDHRHRYVETIDQIYRRLAQWGKTHESARRHFVEVRPREFELLTYWIGAEQVAERSTSDLSQGPDVDVHKIAPASSEHQLTFSAVLDRHHRSTMFSHRFDEAQDPVALAGIQNVLNHLESQWNPAPPATLGLHEEQRQGHIKHAINGIYQNLARWGGVSAEARGAFMSVRPDDSQVGLLQSWFFAGAWYGYDLASS